MAVAFAGERGSFAELAALEYFGRGQRVAPVPEFGDVFRAVARGRATAGVVPIENSLSGSIHQNYDLLLEHRLSIAGEIYLGVSQFLIADKGVKRSDVKRIYSHPQALAQCRDYLRRLRGVESVAVANTAGAVRMIKEQRLRDAAAIASLQAAIDYDMQVLARNIQDHTENTTRFLVLSRAPQAGRRRAGPTKTSIVFSAKNVPGALFRCLAVFALRDIDLHKIESRPVRGKGFAYLFYLDFAGSASDEAQANALAHLSEITVFQRNLGSYPVGRLAHPEYRRR
jgi:prephenate dehydratase